MEITHLRLSRSPKSFKVLVTCFVLSLSVGYLIAVLQAYSRTSLSLEETVLHFRGGEGGEEQLAVPQSDATLISVAHVHSLSQPVVIGLLSVLFLMTSLREAVKIGFLLAGFLGSFLSLIGPWLIRDLSAQGVPLLYIGGSLMAISFLVMATSILYETWNPRRD